jgi:FkbM family methyltransferase
VIRNYINRLLSSPVRSVLRRVEPLEQAVSLAIDRRKLAVALARLRRRGVDIEVVYDIGARIGWWTETVRPALPRARFFLFEANDAHTPALQATGERYFTVLLSAEEKPIEFFATGSPGDSYFREATEHYADVVPQVIQATTLDRVVEHHQLPYPDLIKADVQGAELDVLRGGRKTLERTKVVLLECPIVRYNDGAPEIHEYFEFMDDAGFTPVEFLGRTWHKGRMIQIDVLFARIGAAQKLVG